MNQKSVSVRPTADHRNQLIDKLVDAIDLARTVGDPVTVSLLKMALLREVESVKEASEAPTRPN